MKKKSKSRNALILRPSGSALIEMILGVMISIILLTMAAKYMAQAMADVRAKNVAEHLQSFQQAAAQYYIGNATAMRAAMADGTDAASFCIIRANTTTGVGGTQANDTALHTCAMDANWLIYRGVLPGSFKPTNIFGQRFVAIFRRIFDASNNPTEQAEMLVVAMQEAGSIASPDYLELATVGEILGGNGGVIPDKDRAACKAVRSTLTYEACGTQGGWKVDLSKFISSAQLATFSNSLPN